MIVHNYEQRSEDWFNVRKGKVTASNGTAIGNCGKGLITYVNKVMAEFYSSAEKERYTNKDLQRGIELEEHAVSVYELETGETIEEVGFCEYNEYAGASPDGLIGSDGLIEIKCKNDEKHFQHLLHGEKAIESGYRWQVAMQLLVTGRKYCNFVCYNPNFENSLLVYRIDRDETKIERLREGIAMAGKMIEEIKSKI